MKVQKIYIKSFDALNEFTADLNGMDVFLCADNRKGKSTIMRAIRYATGLDKNIPKGLNANGVIVTSDEDGFYEWSFEVKDGLNKVTVKRPDGSKLTDKNKDKVELKKISKAHDFNLMEFVSLSNTDAGRKKQVEIFRSFLPEYINEEIDKHKATIASDEEERKSLNQDISKLKGVIDLSPFRSLPDTELEKMKPVDTALLMDSQKKITEHNQKISDFKIRMEAMVQEVANNENTAKDIIKQIEELQEKLKAKHTEIETGKANIAKGNEWLAKNTLQDVTEIDNQIKNASELNRKASLAEQLLKDRKKLEAYTSQWEDFDCKIKITRQLVSDLIKDIANHEENPVPGVGFNEDYLTYEGIPVHEQSLSTATIIVLGITMYIAKNSEYGIVFIEGANEIGREMWNRIFEMKEQYGFQIIAEKMVMDQDEISVVELTLPPAPEK
jgi:hypothetical protein